MSELQKQAAAALDWLRQFGITGSDALPYVALACGLLALLIALSNRRKLRAMTEAAGAQGMLPAGGEPQSAGAPEKKKSGEAAAPAELTAEQPAAASIHSGLAKTRTQFFSRLASIVKGRKGIDPDTYNALEELLITSDLGVKTAEMLLGQLKQTFSNGQEINERDLTAVLKQQIEGILSSEEAPEIVPIKQNGGPMVVLVVGVNGVGKTTTIGKLAAQFKVQGARVLLGACDTFRAAAGEQLSEWARRAGADIVAGEEGAKPTTVAYQAAHKAIAENYDVLIVDTAGRLHTRVNLMNELVSVVRILEREIPGAPHETVLVLDASTGQNALQQAREFNAKAKLSGIIVTKLDGTPKGGIVVAIKDELNVPIRYLGIGEGIFDLKPFDAVEFVNALFAN